MRSNFSFDAKMLIMSISTCDNLYRQHFFLYAFIRFVCLVLCCCCCCCFFMYVRFRCVCSRCFCFIFLRCIKISHDELYMLAEMRRSLCFWYVENRCLYTHSMFGNQMYRASVRISVFLPVCAFFRLLFLIC